jgi:hypothetical protein
MVTWVVWQQLFFFGNTWPLSTVSIESRNARIKRYGRRFTNWRPLVEGFTRYHYIDQRSGMEKTGERRYNSSAVHQILERLCLAQSAWHTNHTFTAPDKIRLQAHLRSRMLKVEVSDATPPVTAPTMLSHLAGKI